MVSLFSIKRGAADDSILLTTSNNTCVYVCSSDFSYTIVQLLDTSHLAHIFIILAIMKNMNPETKNRNMANARERKRMKCINVGFDHLRKQLPGKYHDKRLSKVETLKSAIEYINILNSVLQQHPITPMNSPNFYAFQATIWTPPSQTK